MDETYRSDAVNSGRRFGEGYQTPYRLLGKLEPGLCVDVGANVGRTAKRMLKHSPGSRVIAYEPFAGNQEYLERAVGRDARVAIRAVAVADCAGTKPFVVPAVVAPGETGWARRMLGSSALGYLGRRGAAPSAPNVDVVALDDEIAEHIRFLKIDVQGGELDVLKGASRLMATVGIDIVCVEFNNSRAVLKFLAERDYVIFDCTYIVWPSRRYFRNWLRRRPDRLPDWTVVVRSAKSMGSEGACVWPHVPARGFTLYSAWYFLTRLFRCGMYNDMLCVHRDFLPRLWKAVG